MRGGKAMKNARYTEGQVATQKPMEPALKPMEPSG
jgi:hypothetical protein